MKVSAPCPLLLQVARMVREHPSATVAGPPDPISADNPHFLPPHFPNNRAKGFTTHLQYQMVMIGFYPVLLFIYSFLLRVLGAQLWGRRVEGL